MPEVFTADHQQIKRAGEVVCTDGKGAPIFEKSFTAEQRSFGFRSASMIAVTLSLAALAASSTIRGYRFDQSAPFVCEQTLPTIADMDLKPIPSCFSSCVAEPGADGGSLATVG